MTFSTRKLWSLVFFAVASLAFGGRISCHEPAKPNVLIFYSDDQGYGDRSKYNGHLVDTHVLEDLAKNGMEFTDGHSYASVCTPSRFALLTGVYSFRENPRGGAISSAHSPMVEGYHTMASMFKNAGYRTYMTGKWHLGMRMPHDLDKGGIEGGPLDAGFDEYFGTPGANNYETFVHDRSFLDAPSMWTRRGRDRANTVESCPGLRTYLFEMPYREQRSASWKYNIAPSMRQEYRTSNFTHESIRMIKSHVKNYPRQSFFMYVALTSPHLPHLAHPDFAGKSSYGAYADMIQEGDFRLGEIVETLKDLGVYNDTLIVFTSDNGTEGAPKFEQTGLKTTWIYAGWKRSLLEGGHRVPFVMHWPNGIEPGTVWHGTVSQVDLLKTFAEMTRTPLPEGAARDSFSFWPVVCSPEKEHDTTALRGSQPFVFEDARGRLAVRCGPLKYAETYSGGIFDVDATEHRFATTAYFTRHKFALMLAHIRKHGHSWRTAFCANATKSPWLQEI